MKALQRESRVARWFWPILLGLVVVGGGLRFLQRAEYLSGHPLSAFPIADAQTYWDWAGHIAAGQLNDGQPFFSAPLYPYLLGLLRACGGGLPAIYTCQIFLDLITVVLLATIARRRYGPVVGLLSAGLFLLLLEPASFSLRVLASSVQLPLVCLVWAALLLFQRHATRWHSCLVGGSLGLLALVHAPTLYALPLCAAWCWWNAGHTRAAVSHALITLAAGVALIAPATVHNYRATGEFIPISAQAGITFAQGNAPGALGVYTPLSDVAIARERQNVDAMRVYRQATGAAGTWRGVDSYFFQRGLAYWRSHPAQVPVLTLRKLYWFITGRNYGDIYLPTLERAEGLLTRLWLTPLATASLVLPALVIVAGTWVRRPNLYLPELLLLGLPLLVVVVFFYSPRYRFPALPVLIVACACALQQIAQWRTQQARALAVGGALAVGIALGPINRAIGFDGLDSGRPGLYRNLGTALLDGGRAEQAAEYFRRTLALVPDYPGASADLGNALSQLRRVDEALEYLQRGVRDDPMNPLPHARLGQALAAQRRLSEALPQFRTAVELDPNNAKLHNDLANALCLASDPAGAREHYEIALRIDPNYADAHVNFAVRLQQGGESDLALQHFRQAVRLNPACVPAYRELGRLYLTLGDTAAALDALRRAQQLAPGDPAVANMLAWVLATAPDLAASDRSDALLLATRLAGDRRDLPAELLDTLAAALAANGRFGEAAETVQRAMALADQQNRTDAAQQFRTRLELYKAGRPYVEARPAPGR